MDYDTQNFLIVETTNGPIRGYREEVNDTTYYKFKKIPFAKPPIGPLRFLPPSPITPWREVLDCTQETPVPLSRYIDGKIWGSEDCLYIELSTKNIKPDKPLPVIFWIGSCVFSYIIDQYLDYSLLIDQDVLFVRCGFRLGALGFLSINDYTAPGNCGLKDIVMALKWVQSNIAKFGGDPNNVTLFGNSSGGSSVHFMMLSPMATGLFHKAIVQSSTALNNWSLTKNPSQSVTELAKKLGITKTQQFDIVEELRSFPVEKIVNAANDLQDQLLHPGWNNLDAYFKPCIENDLEGLPAFLTKSPMVLLKSGNYNKVPIIIGSNNIEESFFKLQEEHYLENFPKYNEDISLIVPKSLSHDIKESKEVALKLLEFYVPGETTLNESTKAPFLRYVLDYIHLNYVNYTVRLHSESASQYPLYYYVVNCAGEWNVPPELWFLNNLADCSEIAFIFGIKLNDSQICKGSRNSVTTRKRMIKMWTNFAKYGDPTPDETDPLLQIKWERVEHKRKLKYLSIGTDLTKGTNPFHDRMEFWDKLHTEFTISRILTYFNDSGISSW